MSALLEKARAAQLPAMGEEQPRELPATTDGPAALVPFAELDTTTSDDPPPVSVFIAWARVMREVQAVGKTSVMQQTSQKTGKTTRYNFRGVDAMINAFGPACRKHGVLVIPTKVARSHASANSSGGSSMRETTVTVSWRIYGPLGDFIEGESSGESLDTADKGTAKAQTVALRVFLIAAGLVPTDEPDPDSSHHERGERPKPKPTDYRDEIVNHRTSLGRLNQIKQELLTHNLSTAVVQNEVGDEEQLIKLLWRFGRDAEARQSQQFQAQSDGDL